MKISERLALLKAGYTKEDINAMIDEEAQIVEEAPQDSPADSKQEEYMKVISALAGEVKDLKEAVYKKNIDDTEVRIEPEKKAEDILAELFSAPKKEV